MELTKENIKQMHDLANQYNWFTDMRKRAATQIEEQGMDGVNIRYYRFLRDIDEERIDIYRHLNRMVEDTNGVYRIEKERLGHVTLMREVWDE